MTRLAALALLLLATGVASADVPLDPPPGEELRPEVQLDFGLGVIGVGYEQPVLPQLSVMVAVDTASTYFMPWFDAGESLIGYGGEVRATFFARSNGKGLYVTPFVRVDRMHGSHDGESGHGTGFAAGAFVGWDVRLAPRLDLRLGVGAQYMRYLVDTPMGAFGVDSSFFGLDGIFAYRL